MPEIAECRRYVDQLNDKFGGQNLHGITIVGGRFVNEGLPGLSMLHLMNLPLTNTKFDSKGKFIYATFDQPVYFFITLGMAASFGNRNKHSAVKFTFDSDEVFYNDIRHFGTIKIVYEKTELDKKLKSLGWDALQNPQMPSNMIDLFHKSRKTIAEFLLDQKVFAGVGNYIRSEVLYRSKIAPWRQPMGLTDQEVSDVCNNIIAVAKEAYAAGGATIATYSDMYGIAGTYFQNFQVYGKKQDPLGNAVERFIAGDGRTVHWVREIQK